MRNYARTWKHSVWGKSSLSIAKAAEVMAITRILPRLGFTNLVHISKLSRYVPFDVVGTWKGARVLVDVTTCVGKGGPYLSSAISLAEALRVTLFILFVKPDLKSFALKPVKRGHDPYCSLSDLEMLRD